jgi:hypothetical protein
MRDAAWRTRVSRAEATFGAACFVAAIGAGLSGAILWLVVRVIGPDLHPWAGTTATVLLVATIPLILCAGYFLDLSETNRERSSFQNDSHRTNSHFLSQSNEDKES